MQYLNGNTPHFGILYIIITVEVTCPRKNYSQIKDGVSKDKLSARFYASTDETCMYLGQHHPHTILGTVIDQNVNSLPGVPRMQNCTTNVIFLSISRQKIDVFCFFFSNILFTFISFYFSVSFTPGTSVWQVPRQRPASCLGGRTGRKMLSVLLMSVQHLLWEQSWAAHTASSTCMASDLK